METTLAHIEQTRARLAVDEFRAGYLEDKLAAYHELATLLLAASDTAGALRVIERAKARTLVDLLRAGPESRGASQVSSGELDHLTAELHARRRTLERPDAALAPKVRRQLEREITDLARQVSGRSAPRYGSAAAGYVAEPAAVAAQLPSDTLVVSYAVLGDQVWAFLMDRGGLREEPVPLGQPPEHDEVRLDLARITGIGRLPRVTAERWLAQQIRGAQAPLGRWRRQYLTPLQESLGRYSRLLIIPDGLLNLLPFPAFYDDGTGRYLAQTHTITLAPSLTVWSSMPNANRETVRRVLAVGFSSGGRMPHAVGEARQVAARFPGATLLLEEQATRSRLAEAASEADLVYLATHGVYRPDAPAFSFLELADGRLEASDIAGLELAGATVVLSACETGVGKLTGNELMGLVRAFLYAGARTVLATSWPVADEAAAALMIDVADRLHSGDRLEDAVRAAQCVAIAGQDDEALFAHPFFWGSFAVIGRG